ncbi:MULTISPECIES: hypothetical protein [unclassified Streptomyces]|uniref:hypothetical protein n=1 Tax=unclassified Streptomyces TaxID=2593676 RepID=UPI002E81D0C0|nr:hypothetical protein [Streptomyces sp. NBC_00562]WUC24955.1 hypothetical protein OHA33_43030 [Streptomyces sp. NBC_00562]
MPGKPLIPTHVQPYQQMAQHLPVEQYHAALACQCGHGHSPQPVQQQIIVKQSDPWVRYIAMGFAGAGVALMMFASQIATLIAAGACALFGSKTEG